MVELNLSKEKLENLSKEILRLKDKYRKKKYIECIYMNLYLDEVKNANICEITLVCENLEDCEKLSYECKRYNDYLGFKSLMDNDVLINLVWDYSNRYIVTSKKIEELSLIQDILNSIILLDRDNKYTDIKDNNWFQNYEYPNTLIMEPPLILKKSRN